ncbi:MAG: TolC family outer membrane protein [Alcanivoracaceae bacterium]|nr:TolC family outer membrane protein [Alcanivoracaceae bacterium]
MHQHLRYLVRATALGLALTSSAGATDLEDVLNAARDADPEFAAAQRTWQADQQAVKQGRGALMPSINAQYSHVRSDQTLEDAPVAVAPGDPEQTTDADQDFDLQTTTVSVVQPLFRPEAWYSYTQGKALTSVGEARFEQARQDFLLRVAQRYTEVLRTWDNLLAARAAERAFSRQLDQTRERFDVGLVPITDLHEAQAARDLGTVNRIVAESDFSVARNNLEAFTGMSLDSIDGLAAEIPISGPQPADPEAWVERALAANPSLLAARYQADAAKATARQGLSRQLPTVDLVGQYQHQHYLDEDFYDPFNTGRGGQNVRGNSIGVEVNIPLFAGGALNSQRLQSSYQYQATEEQYRLTHRNISQNARSLTQVVAANAQRVGARRQALVSAKSVLQATQSGYEVGTRNAVDLLNAQQRLFQAQSDYANARYDYILDSLRLKALAGMLTEQDILEINGWLSASVTVRMEAPAQGVEASTQAEADGNNAANP